VPRLFVDVERRKAYALRHTPELLSLVGKIMSELSLPRLPQKKDWTLSPPALRRHLKWVDDGAESEGQKYLVRSRRLVAYFDRKGCWAPDDLADETLNRVARRLEEEGRIESDTPAKYCYIVARFVFMEHLRATRFDCRSD